jgi:hypothetical protein
LASGPATTRGAAPAIKRFRVSFLGITKS